jgi:hypothetical protein
MLDAVTYDAAVDFDGVAALDHDASEPAHGHDHDRASHQVFVPELVFEFTRSHPRMLRDVKPETSG